ncbi:hypothetical protein MMC18_004057 [Xylographa bjoerkii]|nr:hypothetical protein [Xylographa bjoerkii]
MSPNPPIAQAPMDQEDDYMSMTIAEPSAPKQKETYTQRRIRKAREAELRSRQPSKAELAALSAQNLTAALSTSLPQTSKGFQMLSKLGYKPGSTLGAEGNPHARIEPLGVAVKEDRGGIGLDSERKRKFREYAEGEMERERAEAGGYRERVAREREERRTEGLVRGAMGVLEGFEGEVDGETEAARDNADGDGKEGPATESGPPKKIRKPTRQINVLWRGLVRQREEKERERRMRYDLHQSLSRNTNYDNPDEDAHDRQALGKEEEEIDEEDSELEEFNALEPAERLRKLVEYLRDKFHYCFWCKFRYPDGTMEGCPGVAENDHD